jgi:hypothetical protein
MAMKVESLEGMEITPAAPRWSFSLRSLISLVPISCFYVLAVLLFMTRRGILYIVSFRSRRIQQDEDRRHRSYDEGTGRPHMARESSHMGLAHLALVAPLLHLLRS